MNTPSARNDDIRITHHMSVATFNDLHAAFPAELDADPGEYAEFEAHLGSTGRVYVALERLRVPCSTGISATGRNMNLIVPRATVPEHILPILEAHHRRAPQSRVPARDEHSA